MAELSLKIKIFETKDNKAPLGKWKDSKDEVSLKDIIEGNFPASWRNVALIVPKNFSVYDFDAPKGVDTKFYKTQVIRYLKLIFNDKMPNLIVETDKGIHLWVRGVVSQTAGMINQFGLYYDVRSNEDGYVVIKRKGKVRPTYGSANHAVWNGGKKILGVSKTSLSQKETEFFNSLWAKKDFNGQRNNTMFSVYRAFLFRHFKLFNPKAREEAGFIFNTLWDWRLTNKEIAVIMASRDTDKGISRTVELESQKIPVMSPEEAAYPFELKYSKQAKKFIPVEKKGMVIINMAKALKYFVEDYGPRIMKLDDSELIFVNNDGFWIKDLEEQLLFPKRMIPWKI